MFKRVEVTFTNKDGNEETAQGKLIIHCQDPEGNYITFIVLDDSRIVGNYYDPIEELTDSIIGVSVDNFDGFFKFID